MKSKKKKKLNEAGSFGVEPSNLTLEQLKKSVSENIELMKSSQLIIEK